jgi:hypothetical protein
MDMPRTLNEKELKVLLKELLEHREYVNDGICPLCHDIHYDGERCHCDNDD